MKLAQELYNERITRLKTTITTGMADRVPVNLFMDVFCAKHLGVKVSEFYTNMEVNNNTILASVAELGDVDSLGAVMTSPYMLSAMWLSNIKFPGKGLPEGMVAQIDEVELIKVEDYDTILDKGWPAFLADFMANRLAPETFPALGAAMQYGPIANQKTTDAGYVMLFPVMVNPPFDTIAGGRSMTPFIKDLFKRPDKVEAVLDVILEDTIANLKKSIKETNPLSVFIGGARCSSQFLSPKLWERFTWKYIRKLVEVIIEAGSVAYLHFDGDWLRDLPRFLELPKRSFIMNADATNDIMKYKGILGDHCCIYGDVSPALLTLGTPDEVYNYCRMLIKEIGPTGLILAAGCSVPYNAKVENVKAMVAAASGK